MGADGGRPEGLEVTNWTKGDRTLVLVLTNAPVTGSAQGGGGAEGLVQRQIALNVEFAHEVADAIDERGGRRLGDGRRFAFQFNGPEAIFLSFRGKPRGDR